MNGRVLHWIRICAAGLALSLVAAAARTEEGFPLRAKFPEVKQVTTAELDRQYDRMIIVDVRSKIEYSVIHINKAVNIPVSTARFTRDLAAVREKGGSVPIAFYCNGHTCAKSYEAAEQAREAGFQNVFAYDAGIYEWVKAHPEKGALMGVTPVALDKLIPKDALAKRTITYDEFKKRADSPRSMVIDIREPFQREKIPPLPLLRNIPSDRFVGLLKSGEFKDKELLILDAVGKQVQWIQYYLEMHGYKDYYFLDRGVKSAVEPAPET